MAIIPLTMMSSQMFTNGEFLWSCLPPNEGHTYCIRFEPRDFCETVMDKEGNLKCIDSI